MAESEMAKNVTRVIKKVDKLIRDVKKDTEEALEAARELKGRFKNEEDSETE